MRTFCGLVISFSIAFCLSVAGQSKSDLKADSFGNIPRTGTTAPDLKENPYGTVRVYLRNDNRLTDKTFIGKFNKINSFLAEFTINDGGRTTTVPLFLLKKGDDAFSTSSFRERTIIRNVPLAVFGNSTPTFQVASTAIVQDQILHVIKMVTEKVKPLIGGGAVFGVASPTTAFDFLANVVGQLNDSKSVSSSVGFELVSPADTGIKPHSYSVALIKPGGSAGISGALSLNVDPVDNQLKLYEGTKVVADYPYFIVELGVSNYVELPTLPSKFLAQNNACDLTLGQVTMLRTQLDESQKLLSDEQLRAERHLISRATTLVSLSNGTRFPDDPNLISAYNARFQEDLGGSTEAPTSKLFKERYSTPTNGLDGCIKNASKNLALDSMLMSLAPILKKEVKDVSNADLAQLRFFRTSIASEKFMSSTTWTTRALRREHETENYMFETQFANRINDFMALPLANNKMADRYQELNRLRQDYSNCTKCQADSRKIDDQFNKLMKEQSDYRSRIMTSARSLETTIQANEIVLLKAKFMIERDKQVDPTKRSPMEAVVDPAKYQAMIDSMKAKKEQLASYVERVAFSDSDRTAIDALLSFGRRNEEDLLGLYGEGEYSFRAKSTNSYHQPEFWRLRRYRPRRVTAGAKANSPEFSKRRAASPTPRPDAQGKLYRSRRHSAGSIESAGSE